MSRVLPSFSRQADSEDYEYDQREELSPLLKQFAAYHVQHLDTPKTFPERIEWANSKMWDFSEGKINANELNMVMYYLGGWMDLCADHERNAYRQIQKHIHSLLSEHNGNKLAKNKAQPTAVDAARSRNANSIVQQVNSIIAGKSRYATVDDAVKDMTERTGLSTYLDTIKSAEESKKKVNKNASEDLQIPSSLAQYDFAGQVISYIQNNIKNSNAHSVAIPALQADILEIFGRRGLQSQDVMNDEFEKYLSDCIYEAQKMLPPEYQNNNIGRGVGKDIEDSNDAWLGLMPAK